MRGIAMKNHRNIRRWLFLPMAAATLLALSVPAAASVSTLGLVEVSAEQCLDDLLADPVAGPVDCVVSTQNRSVNYLQRYAVPWVAPTLR
jgi:hypothetical protein